MISGITQTAIGAALAGTIGSSLVLKPSQRPYEEAVFLERLAVRVERAATLPPETRDYLAALAGRHANRPAEKTHEVRRERALTRLADAIAGKSPNR